MRALAGLVLSACALIGAWAADDLGPRVIAHIDITGTPEQVDLAKASLARVLQTDTGQLMGEMLLGQGRPKLGYKDFPTTRLVERNGQKQLMGLIGNTSYKTKIPSVDLSDLFLTASPAYAHAQLPMTLAHELFGHTLHYLEARAAGVSGAYKMYEGDERIARLTEWLVGAELRDLEDWSAFNYVRDPNALLRSLEIIDPGYSTLVSFRDLRDPVPVLKGRLIRCRKARERLPQHVRNLQEGRAFLTHLFKKHPGQEIAGFKIEASRFEWITARFPEWVQTLTARSGELQRTETALEKRIAFYESADGRKYLARISETLDSRDGYRFFEDVQKEEADDAARLAKAVKTLKPPPSDYRKGQVSWPDLGKILKADLLQDPELKKQPLAASLWGESDDRDWATLASRSETSLGH